MPDKTQGEQGSPPATGQIPSGGVFSMAIDGAGAQTLHKISAPPHQKAQNACTAVF
jgi:hypothetical protein